MKKCLILVLILIHSLCWGKENLELLIAPEAISKKIKEAALKIDKTYQTIRMNKSLSCSPQNPKPYGAKD